MELGRVTREREQLQDVSHTRVQNKNLEISGRESNGNGVFFAVCKLTSDLKTKN